MNIKLSVTQSNTLGKYKPVCYLRPIVRSKIPLTFPWLVLTLLNPAQDHATSNWQNVFFQTNIVIILGSSHIFLRSLSTGSSDDWLLWYYTYAISLTFSVFSFSNRPAMGLRKHKRVAASTWIRDNGGLGRGCWLKLELGVFLF